MQTKFIEFKSKTKDQKNNERKSHFHKKMETKSWNLVLCTIHKSFFFLKLHKFNCSIADASNSIRNYLIENDNRTHTFHSIEIQWSCFKTKSTREIMICCCNYLRLWTSLTKTFYMSSSTVRKFHFMRRLMRKYWSL